MTRSAHPSSSTASRPFARLLAACSVVFALAACDFGVADREPDDRVTVRPRVVIDGLVHLSARTEGRLFVDEVVFHVPDVTIEEGAQSVSDVLASDPSDQGPLLFRYDVASAEQGSTALAGERRWNLSPAGATATSDVVFGFRPLDATARELDDLSATHGADLDALNGYTAYVHGYVSLDDHSRLFGSFSAGRKGPSASDIHSGDPEGDPSDNAESGDPEGDPTAASGDPEGDPTANSGTAASGDPEGDPTANSGDPEGDPTANSTANSGDPEGDPTDKSGDPEGDPSDPGVEADPEGDPASGDPEPDPMDTDELSASSASRMEGMPFVLPGNSLNPGDTLVPFLLVLRAPLELALPLPELDGEDGEAVPMDLHVDANALFTDDRLADLDSDAMSVVRGDASVVFGEVDVDEARDAFAIAADSPVAARSQKKTPTRERGGSLNVTGDSRDDR